MDRIMEINQILCSRKAELENCTPERMIEIENETTALINEKNNLVSQRKKDLKLAFENGKSIDIEVPVEDQVSRNSEELKRMNLRQKVSYGLGKVVRNLPFNDAEKRALSSMVTTADTFLKAVEDSTEGHSNGGVFIKTNVLFDLLKEEGTISGIANDIVWTSYPGLTKYPYRNPNTKSSTNYKPEGKKVEKDSQYEWLYLNLKEGYLISDVPVTDEVKLKSEIDLGSYILDLLLMDFEDNFISQLIYGDGTQSGDDKHIAGIVYGATQVNYSNPTDGIIAAITALKKEYRRGAKVYVAQDVYDKVIFEKDSNGNFKYPIVNNQTGLVSFGTVKIICDESLADGDIVAGNVEKYFKCNEIQGLTVEVDRDKRFKKETYIVSAYVNTAPVPNAFAYYKYKASSK